VREACCERHRLPSPSERAVAPPEGPPWDLPIERAPIALIDLEMTGLDVQKDRVIEIAILRTEGSRIVDSLHSLIEPAPCISFPPGVHGLDAESLRGAPTFAGVADRVLAILHGAVPVAHAASWDVSFLEAELARSGKPDRFAFYLDTLTLSRRAFASETHALGALANRLGISRTNPHRAFDDARVLSELFAKLVAELSPRTARDLWHVRVGERHARPDIVTACVVAAETAVKVLISYRPSHKQPRRVCAVVTRVRTDLDPPRVMGYALPGRGRFDLRADRILAVLPNPDTESDP
jgi:DNA polymerase III subunit epsilon